MATQGDLKLVRALYAGSPDNWVAAFADATFMDAWKSAFEPILHRDFEISFIVGPARAGLVGLEGTYRGVDGFYAIYRDWLQAWETYQVRLEEVLDLGERIAVLSEWGGRSRTGGVELFQPGADIWTLLGSKVVQLDAYMNRQDAMHIIGPAIEGNEAK